jgi:glycosyltransferase involved in cell wall biosynthesis
LYGSGGCSLYDTRKLRSLGGLGEAYAPAYVEDLDIGVRAWQMGWPTVFAANARTVHAHRSTTSRYFTEAELERVLETNYLRFLARTVRDPDLFLRLWNSAIARLNRRAALEHHAPSLAALQEAWGAPQWVERPLAGSFADDWVFGAGSGEIGVFPGRARRHKRVVAVASSYSPFPLSHGGAVRIYNLMLRAARDFAQVLICFVDELHPPPSELLDICVEIVQVRRLGSHVHQDTGRPEVVEDFDRPSFRAALRQTVRKWAPAIVQLEFTQMGLYAADCAPARTVLVEHDITLDLYRQLLAGKDDWDLRHQLERWERFEPGLWSQVDAVVTMSDKDARIVQGARRAVTLPNGVDLQRFSPCAAEPEQNRILFIGSFAHLPNLLALDFFVRDIWPHLADLPLTLHVIAGANHEQHYHRFREQVGLGLDSPGLALEGFVADVRPAYRRATAVIAPLLASAGTNIKICEAMAMGKAIVSTPGGINGLDELIPGREVLVEHDPACFADALRLVLTDAERRRELERGAREAAERYFNWDHIADRQRRFYEEMLSRS